MTTRFAFPAAVLVALIVLTRAPAQTNIFPASGNVGIGTVSPGAKLTVCGGGGGSIDLVVNGRILTGDASGAGGIWLNSAETAFIGAMEGNSPAIYTAGAGWGFVMLQNGNVGIGTTSPQQRLEIGSNGGIGFSGSSPFLVSSDKMLYCPIDGDLEWRTHSAASGHGFAISHQGTKVVYLNISGNSYLNGGNVGIGTTSPTERLTFGASQGTSVKIADYAHFGTDYSAWSTILGSNVRAKHGQNAGMELATSYLDSGASAVRMNFGTIEFHAASSADIAGYAAGTAFAFPRMVVQASGNVGIGTTTPSEKLAVNGRIRAKEVIVETNWSDFVFDPGYRLAPLSEVERHIKAHGTLPGVPSEAEVAKEGVSVGDMQARLLQKVEELTLHAIEQEKEIAALRRQVKELQSR